MPGIDRRHRSRQHRSVTFELEGVIGSAAFASGDRFVVGHWSRSPLGPMTDVMWAGPDGKRVLLAPRREVADFVSAIYTFEEVRVVPMAADFDGRRLDLRADSLQLTMRAGPGWRLPLASLRPPWVTRWVETRVAGPLLGVRTYGVSPTGVRQWYRAHEYRRVVEAQGRLDGADLGPLRPFDEPVRFGFSGPPRRPSMVMLRSTLVDPSGRLAAVVDR